MVHSLKIIKMLEICKNLYKKFKQGRQTIGVAAIAENVAPASEE